MLRPTKRLMLAIEAVVDIAYNASELPVQSSDIAQRQDISKRYLEPVLQQLVHADILSGVRGPHGGYRLSRSRRRISLGEITRVVAAMEGTTDPLDEAARSDLGQAVLRPLWQELNDTAITRLESVSIDDICRRARAANVEPPEAPQFDFMSGGCGNSLLRPLLIPDKVREMDITDEQLARYARHIILDEVGEEGQLRLLQSKVLVVGAGGLGSPLLMYLAAAGVGTLGIVDHDLVDITNLQRQIVHKTEDVGQSKVSSAAEAVFDINPEVNVVTHRTRLTQENVASIVSQYDLIADGSDNFPTRYLINDACFFAERPLVSAAVLRFEGQISTFVPYKGGDNPCYRCLFPTPPPPDLVPRCEQVGIFGSLAGVMGSIQTTEVLKYVLGLGASLSGKLLIYDALNTTFRKISVKPSSSCALCGEHPTITADAFAERV